MQRCLYTDHRTKANTQLKMEWHIYSSFSAVEQSPLIPKHKTHKMGTVSRADRDVLGGVQQSRDLHEKPLVGRNVVL